MKFPIAFLSLLTTAAYAQHEPKSLRGGSVEDFDFLENNVVTVGPNSVATINCGSGYKCCVQDGSHCGSINPTGSSTFGDGICLTGGTVTGAGKCDLSCTGTCNVSVAAHGGSGGGGGRGGGGNGWGWGWPNGGGRSAYGCGYMPPSVCTWNHFCSLDENGNCAPSGQAPPYEEFDEEADYDSSFDEEDEGAYDMAAEE